MLARHWAALSTLIIAVASVATFLVATGLREDLSPKIIGEYEAYGTKTKILKAGPCMMYVTNFTPNLDHSADGTQHNPNVRMYYSCEQK